MSDGSGGGGGIAIALLLVVTDGDITMVLLLTVVVGGILMRLLLVVTDGDISMVTLELALFDITKPLSVCVDECILRGSFTRSRDDILVMSVSSSDITIL